MTEQITADILQIHGEKDIPRALKQIKVIYRDALTIGYESQERIILNIYYHNSKRDPKLKFLCDTVKSVINKYPDDTYPHDSSLLREFINLLPSETRHIVYKDDFDKDMMTNDLYFKILDVIFVNILTIMEYPREKSIIENLRRVTRNTLIDNPNFKGPGPYYKTHTSDYERSKKLSLELLDKDFDDWIEYFSEEREEAL